MKKIKEPGAIATQTALKLFVNTTWGIITSVYFRLNNVVLSEMVTGSIRTYVWLIAKAFNTALSVTDGGPYELTNVAFLKTGAKKPGLNSLSSPYIMQKISSIEYGPLGGIDWKTRFEKKVSFSDLDALALDHLKNFWAPFGIVIKFELEHKIDNTFYKAAYMLKAHYAFHRVFFNREENRFLYKIRGFRLHLSLKHLHPIYLLLKHIL